MMRYTPFLSIGCLLALGLPLLAQEGKVDHEKAVAEIRKRGGTVEAVPGWTGLRVILTGPKVGNADLVWLKSLNPVRTLDLRRTRVTDEGLVHLQALDRLEILSLENTKVTDAGLANLQALRGLKQLSLWGTGVTDAGLVHLQGMKSLESVNLWDTKVTEVGARGLREAMPQVEVRYYFKSEQIKERARSSLIFVLPIGILFLGGGIWFVRASLTRTEFSPVFRARSFIVGAGLSLFSLAFMVITILRAFGLDVNLSDLWR